MNSASLRDIFIPRFLQIKRVATYSSGTAQKLDIGNCHKCTS